MIEAAVAESADIYRVLALSNSDTNGYAALSQYMTPVATSQFLADLFSETKGDIRAPDTQAGVGSLTAAFAERGCVATHRAISFAQMESSFSTLSVSAILMPELHRRRVEFLKTQNEPCPE